jgi:hypothetical protein
VSEQGQTWSVSQYTHGGPRLSCELPAAAVEVEPFELYEGTAWQHVRSEFVAREKVSGRSDLWC